jgi:hypothetical protein
LFAVTSAPPTFGKNDDMASAIFSFRLDAKASVSDEPVRLVVSKFV